MEPLKLRARDDEGSVLIAVVGIMVVLTVLVIGAFAMSGDNLLQSRHERISAQALSVAESGLNQMMWRIGSEGTTSVASGVPVQIIVRDPANNIAGTAWVRAIGGGGIWHVTATGSSVASSGIVRTVEEDVMSMGIYNMFFSQGMNPGSNGRINGNGTFHGSAYMVGDWPATTGNASFLLGPFFVKNGDMDLGGSASVGSPPPDKPVDLYVDGAVNVVGYYTVHTSVPNIPMPDLAPDLAADRTTAANESSDTIQGTPDSNGGLPLNFRESTCPTMGVPDPLAQPFADRTYSAASVGYKIIDNDSVINTSVAEFYLGTTGKNGVTLPSFGAPYDPMLGHSPDDFAWDAAKGVLTVQGTVFIDAQDLYLKNVRWAGKGLIVCTGNVHITGKWEPACRAQSNPADNILPPDGSPAQTDDELFLDNNRMHYPYLYNVGVAAMGDIYEYSPSGVGVFYSGTSWSMDPGANGQSFYGEIAAPDITLGKHSDVWCTSNMQANLPAGMPGGGQMITATSGWRETTATVTPGP